MKGELKVFADIDEVEMAYALGTIGIHTRKVKVAQVYDRSACAGTTYRDDRGARALQPHRARTRCASSTTAG
jgi:hypothetical protein